LRCAANIISVFLSRDMFGEVILVGWSSCKRYTRSGTDKILMLANTLTDGLQPALTVMWILLLVGLRAGRQAAS